MGSAVSEQKKSRNNAARTARRHEALDAVRKFVPEYASGSLEWTRLRSAFPDSFNLEAIIGHRTDCPRHHPQCSPPLVLELGRGLAHQTGFKAALTLRREARGVSVSKRELAEEFSCPQYVFGTVNDFSHEQYHAWLDLFRDTDSWNILTQQRRTDRASNTTSRAAMKEVFDNVSLTYEDARGLLGLPRWQMELACTNRLLHKVDQRILRTEVDVALANMDDFKWHLESFEVVSAGKARSLLDISPAFFKELREDGTIIAKGEVSGPYGKLEGFQIGDLRAVRKRLPKLANERHERIARNRKAGAVKANGTRKCRDETVAGFREQLNEVAPLTIWEQ